MLGLSPSEMRVASLVLVQEGAEVSALLLFLNAREDHLRAYDVLLRVHLPTNRTSQLFQPAS